MKKKQRSKYCQANVGSRSAKLEQSVNMKTIGMLARCLGYVV